MEAQLLGRRLSTNHRDEDPHQANEQNNSNNSVDKPQIAGLADGRFPPLWPPSKSQPPAWGQVCCGG